MIDDEKNLYLVIDAGGTSLKTALLNRKGEAVRDSFCSLPSHSEGSKKEIKDSLTAAIDKELIYIKESSLILKGIGISIPGPFDYNKGIALMQHKYESLYGTNLADLIKESVPELKSIPITFIHDVNAVLMGVLSELPADFNNVAVITLGTGLGFSYCKNRVIQCKKEGSPLQSLYNIPCNEGILEDYVSKRGIENKYKELSGVNEQITVKSICEKAQKGDIYAIQTFESIADILAGILDPLLKEKEIEVLFFGGQISHSFSLWGERFKAEMKLSNLKVISCVGNINLIALKGALNYMIM